MLTRTLPFVNNYIRVDFLPGLLSLQATTRENMKPANGIYEPLLGYIILEQSQIAADLLGHRLVYVKKTDLK